jgi:hypothetical protein
MSPAAEWSPFARVLLKSEGAQPFREYRVLCVGRDLGNDIDVIGSANARGARIVNQETGRAASHKDDFRQKQA